MPKQDSDDWDAHPIFARATHTSKSSIAVTFINFTKSMFGAGFLSLPYAFKNIGYLGGLIGLPILVFAIELGIRCLLRVKRELRMRGYREEELTYAGMGRILLGRIGLMLVMTTLAVAQIGTCVAYVIFAQQSLEQLYDGIPQWGYGLMMTLIQIILCQIRALDGLRWTSVLGCGLVAIIFCVIYGFNLHSLASDGAADIIPFDSKIRHFPRFIGIVTFAVEGITMVLPLETSMREPKHFLTIVDAALVACGIILLTFGELGYMVYGDSTEDMITKNIEDGGPHQLVHFIDGLLLLNLVFTFPIQMFPVTEILDKEFVKRDQPRAELWRSLIRFGMVCFTGGFGILVPDIGGVLGVMGGLCFIFIGVLFPILFFLILFEELLNSFKFWGLIILAILASSVSMLVTVNAVIDTITGDS